MADMGFLPDVRRILDLTPDGRQTLLFSATLDGDIDVLVKRYQNNPTRHELEVDEDDASAAIHLFWRVSSGDRLDRTAEVVTASGPTIVFSRTKHGADRIARQLEQRGIRAAAIHGDRSQKQREKALDSFVRGAVDALVATDVAARGIHVDGVNAVVHFDPSADPEGLRPSLGSDRPGRSDRCRRQLRHAGQGRRGEETAAGARRADRHHGIRSRRHRGDPRPTPGPTRRRRSARPVVTVSHLPTPTAAASGPRDPSSPASPEGTAAASGTADTVAATPVRVAVVETGRLDHALAAPARRGASRPDSPSPPSPANRMDSASRAGPVSRGRTTKPGGHGGTASSTRGASTNGGKSRAAGGGAAGGVRRGGAAGARATNGGGNRSQRGR